MVVSLIIENYSCMEDFVKDKYWKCPYCGYYFKDNTAIRCSKSILVGTGKIVAHIGLRMAGGTLGLTIGKIDIGSRLGGQLANCICGNMNDIEFISDRKCPNCKRIIKNNNAKNISS